MPYFQHIGVLGKPVTQKAGLHRPLHVARQKEGARTVGDLKGERIVISRLIRGVVPRR